MHILTLAAIGLVVLAAFVLIAWLVNRSRGGHPLDGARIFIWVWLAASVVNGFIGVLQAGIPVINEIGAFIPIFGIPAIIAWYLSYRRKST